MLSDKISIIVPCYNQAQYLDECLQSVFDQTYENWECIIIDDGSQDNTLQIGKKWEQKDIRFKYFKKQNGGVASARNLGLEKAVGKWILPLDGDDKIGKNYLSAASEKLQNGYDLVYCHADYFGLRNEKFILPEYSFKELLRSNIIFCSAIFNSEKLNGLSYDEKLIHGLEDWDFWINYLSQPDTKVFRLSDTLFYYRIKDISRNENITNDSIKMNETREYILKKNRKIYDATFGDYFYLIGKISSMQKEIGTFQQIIHSKRYRLMNRLFNYIDKIRPIKK